LWRLSDAHDLLGVGTSLVLGSASRRLGQVPRGTQCGDREVACDGRDLGAQAIPQGDRSRIYDKPALKSSTSVSMTYFDEIESEDD